MSMASRVGVAALVAGLCAAACQETVKSPMTIDPPAAPTAADPGGSGAMADITIDAARLQSSAFVRSRDFKRTDCAIMERCVDAGGRRKLLRFDVSTPNIGPVDLNLGPPVNNGLFQYSACHEHYHFSAYASYELLNSTGGVVLRGRKQAFCLEDYNRFDPNARSRPTYTCSNQGISAGWQDEYNSSLDCQWLDVTDLPSGAYQLRVTINPKRIFPESNYGNNAATVPVTIP